MSIFKSEKTFLAHASDLGPVAQDVVAHFQGRGFEAQSERTLTGGWYISITKGKMFAAVLGLQTALNIEIDPLPQGTHVKAGIGVFGRQIVPMLVARFVFWPVMLLQIAAVIHQTKLDDEALECIERSLTKSGTRLGPAPQGNATAFCTDCGAQLLASAQFCQDCGAKLV